MTNKEILEELFLVDKIVSNDFLKQEILQKLERYASVLVSKLDMGNQPNSEGLIKEK